MEGDLTGKLDGSGLLHLFLLGVARTRYVQVFFNALLDSAQLRIKFTVCELFISLGFSAPPGRARFTGRSGSTAGFQTLVRNWRITAVSFALQVCRL